MEGSGSGYSTEYLGQGSLGPFDRDAISMKGRPNRPIEIAGLRVATKPEALTSPAQCVPESVWAGPARWQPVNSSGPEKVSTHENRIYVAIIPIYLLLVNINDM